MPRVRSLSSLIQTASSDTVKQIRVEPSHISLFCSQKDGDYLLNPLPDVKPISQLENLPKLKAKIIKNHMKMEASAREAYKLALSSNLIRGQEKLMVLSSKLFQQDNSEQSQLQATETVKALKEDYKKHSRVQQKLTTAMERHPLKHITCPPQLHNKWILDDTSPQSSQILTHPYKLLINPTIMFGSHPQTHYQQCISFPFMEFMIPRYNRLLIHYYNENYKSQFAYTSGFVSRVIQHQCEHLEGKTVIDWRVNHGVMTMNQSVVQYFPKASAVLEDYSNTLRSVFKDFPQLITLKQQYAIDHTKIDKLLTDILKVNSLVVSQQQDQQKQSEKASHGRSASRSMENRLKQQQNYNRQFTVNKQNNQQQLPFEDDYVVRIVRHFKKEFAKFDQKIQLGLISSDQITKNKNSSIETKQFQLNQYKEEEYSKNIKIKFLNLLQAGMVNELSGKQQKKTKKQNLSSGGYEMSDEQVEKALAKRNKGKKKN